MPQYLRFGSLALIVGLACAAGVSPVLAEDHHDGDAAAHGAGHAADDGIPGLNPLDGYKADLPLWSLITFGIFFILLAKFAWAPLRDGLDARESGVRKSISDAEANRIKAEQLFKEYESKLAQAQEQVREILAEARRDAESTKQDILATAERESAAMRQRAVSEIQRARDGALKDLFDFVSQNVMQATEQVVGRSLTGADQERLVREALASLDLRKN